MGKFICSISTEELTRLYIDERRTLEEMASIIGVKSPITVRRIFRERGIDTNLNQRRANDSKCGMTDLEFERFLRSEYEKGKSMIAIGAEIGLTASGVRKYFVKYGIPRRGNAGYSSFDSSYAANWNGGRHVASNGYVEIKVAGYPYTNSRGYVYEHRYVVEQHIGRFLRKNEVVHHIDGNKQNNDISNLMILTNSEHIKLHSILENSARRMNGEVIGRT